MGMPLTLAVLLTAPIQYSDPVLNLQLDRWQTLNEQMSRRCKLTIAKTKVNKIAKLVKRENFNQLKPRVGKA
jgi:hypothetical protein